MLSDALRDLAGERAEELLGLLRARNGFYAFESALHVRPSAAGQGGLAWWNGTDLWRHEYGELATGHLFFAEDVFGDQFTIRDGQLCRFESETGIATDIAGTIEEWGERLLAEYRELTGWTLAHAWQERHGPLAPGHRLVPKTPFVAGGAFELDNLVAMDAVSGMRFRGYFASQIRDVPEGGKIRFRVVEE